MPFNKIIFDNDGVNVDSEDVAMRVMDDWGVDLIRNYKPAADLPPDYIYRTYPGTSTDKIVEALIVKFELSLEQIAQDYNYLETEEICKTVAEMAKEANKKDVTINKHLAAVSLHLSDLITLETNECFKRILTSIPGATPALIKIREMFGAENVALATTSRTDRMDISLAYAVDPVTGENARLDEMFPKGAQRRSGYGHSNKYDEAFGALEWNPDETMVVEDSLSGVTKAKKGRPGTAVIGTVAARFYEDKDAQAAALLDNGAALVISTMADLPKAAAWLRDGMAPNKKPIFEQTVYSVPKPSGLQPAKSYSI